jgi:hypothetical protein
VLLKCIGLVFFGAFQQWFGIFFSLVRLGFLFGAFSSRSTADDNISSVPLVLVFVAERNDYDNVSLCTRAAVALVSGDASASAGDSESADASALAGFEGLDS